jgi:hypothetical protein
MRKRKIYSFLENIVGKLTIDKYLAMVNLKDREQLPNLKTEKEVRKRLFFK